MMCILPKTDSDHRPQPYDHQTRGSSFRVSSFGHMVGMVRCVRIASLVVGTDTDASLQPDTLWRNIYPRKVSFLSIETDFQVLDREASVS